MSRPVMFRAGGLPGEDTPAAPRVSEAVTAAPAVLLADLSEFQPDVADELYAAWSKAVIIRAAYGAQHDDRAWYGGQRRDLFHSCGIRFLGIYQYVVAGQDPAAQAAALVRLVGQLRPGEKIIADIEEGSGDLRDTWRIWSAEVAGALGDEPWIYSGLNFAASHRLAPVEWVAAYGQSEPAVRHLLWQFTDAFAVPGVGTCDCSIWHGTIDDLAALAYQPAPQPAPQPDPAPIEGWTAAMIADLPTLRQGASDTPGHVYYVHRMQALIACVGRIKSIPSAACVIPDGQFGAGTAAGLRAIQASCGLAQDSICGPLTWAALVAGQHG